MGEERRNRGLLKYNETEREREKAHMPSQMLHSTIGMRHDAK